MAEDPNEIIIPMLRSIREDTAQMKNDVGDIKFRLTQVEETQVHLTKRFDRMEERLGRIETRLDLVEA